MCCPGLWCLKSPSKASYGLFAPLLCGTKMNMQLGECRALRSFSKFRVCYTMSFAAAKLHNLSWHVLPRCSFPEKIDSRGVLRVAPGLFKTQHRKVMYAASRSRANITMSLRAACFPLKSTAGCIMCCSRLVQNFMFQQTMGAASKILEWED